MRRPLPKMLFAGFGGILLTLLTAVLTLVWWSGRAGSEATIPLLYVGIDSPGTLVTEQDPDPDHFFEERVDWPLLQIPEPRTAWEYTQRGMHFQDNEDIDQALADYLQADALERERSCGPGEVPVPGRTCLSILHGRLATIYYERGMDLSHAGATQEGAVFLRQAIDELDFILEESPLFLGLHFELGEIYRELGDPDKAITLFRQELEIQPCHQATHLELGEVYLQIGEIDNARIHLTEYLQQTLLHCDPFPLKILKARQKLEQYGGPLEAPDSHCPALLKGKADQILAVPVSQITARVGCNPVGTDFIESLAQAQVASGQE